MIKRTPLKRGTGLRRIGKRGKINLEANVRLKKIYAEKGITECEIRLPGCLKNWGLGFAHKHKRKDYYQCPEMLGNFYQTILACSSCHDKIEHDPFLTREIFNRLR